MRLMVPMLLSITACAAMNKTPIPETQKDAYYTCRSQSLSDVERNLVMSNTPIASKGDGWVQTDWFRSMSDTTGFGLTQGWLFRVSARSEKEGVVWSAVCKGSAAQDPYDVEITEGNLHASLYVKMYNNVRRRVCGGDDFFPAP